MMFIIINKTSFVVVVVVVVFVSCLLSMVADALADSNGVDQDHDVFGMSKLIQSVFANYNREILPSKPVIVALNLLLLKVKTTVEREGIFESVIALFLEWTDPRIVWDPSLYNNVSELTFDSDKVWLPDVALTNSAEHIYSISKDRTFVIRVTHKGVFNFVPTGTAKTWCDLKLITFPFDIQQCPIEFESWSLNSESLRFNETSTVIIDPSFASLQFSLCGYSTQVYDYYYDVTHESFSRLKFDFVVRRKGSFYVINLIFPIATLSVIQPLVFFIPLKESSSDRVGFGTTPKTSDAITALSKYIIMLIVLSGWAIVESVFVEHLLRISSKPPPVWLTCLLEHICPIKFEHFVSGAPSPQHGNNYDPVAMEEELMMAATPYQRNDDSTTGTNNLMKFLSKICPCRVNENGNLVGVNDGFSRLRRSLSASAVIGPAPSAANQLELVQRQDSAVSGQRVRFFSRSHRHHHQQAPDSVSSSPIPPCSRRPSPTLTQPAGTFVRRRVSQQRRAGQPPSSIRRQRSIISHHTRLTNMARWENVAARLDFVMFVLCTSLAILLPVGLFLPLTLFDDSCPKDIIGVDLSDNS